ncbi:DUF3696 domain-containing protein [Nocardiopsis synnemataformans]|uniref:DUF3696 domain-containing protein n=1 Tax=Nocardiopsis synnemataformans TaxID=61305 RepID=UPI003EB8EBEB
MISSLGIRGFKRFAHADFPLGPLTVLSGLNGTGKSTFIQALLIARQISEPHSGRTVALNGPYGLALGEAQEVIHPDAGSLIEFVLRGDGQRRRYELGVPDERALHLSVEGIVESPMPELSGQGLGFTYLCAERLGPRDQLGVSAAQGSRIGLGSQGEYTAQVLAAHESEQVHERLLHPGTGSAFQGVTTLRTQVEAWTSEIIRPIRITAQWLPGVTASTIRFQETGLYGETIRPANMGFGFSYALPIIVAGLLAPPGGMLIVENPEAHLHPGGQSKMGRFLAKVAGAGVQVVLETHSDHVLNGVRLGASVDGSVPTDDVTLLYFDDQGAGGAVAIGLHANGQLTSWPPGFFDQIETDLGGLARVRHRR